MDEYIMLEYQLFFLSILVILLFGYIYVFAKLHTPRIGKDVAQQILRTAIRSKIESIILDPKFEREFYIANGENFPTLISIEILQNVKEKGVKYLGCDKHIHINNREFNKLLEDELRKDETINLIHKRYSEIYKTIEEAEKIEKDAIEYHNSFGKEPDGDPVLHPAIKQSTTSIAEKEYASIDELEKIGTVEDTDE